MVLVCHFFQKNNLKIKKTIRTVTLISINFLIKKNKKSFKNLKIFFKKMRNFGRKNTKIFKKLRIFFEILTKKHSIFSKKSIKIYSKTLIFLDEKIEK